MCITYIFVDDREIYVNVRRKKRDEEETTHKNPIEEKAGREGCIREREKKECSRKSGVTPNCMPDSDCIFHPFCPLYLSLSLPSPLFCPILLHFPPVFPSYPSALTYGTPVRKRGIRNVIVPLREVSCKAVLLSLIPPPPPRSHFGLSRQRTSGRDIGQSVLRVELVTHTPFVSFQIELKTLSQVYHFPVGSFSATNTWYL